jgi:signal-transduction protein with cAMP-binding, CBS, and nucleotidyltransferase domain
MGGIGEHHPLVYALRGGPRDIVVVSPEGRVVGMLWRHELMHTLNGGANRYRTVRELMDTDVVVADVDDTVYAVQQRMVELGRWAMPITENGYYRGIFTNDRFWHVYRHVSRRPWLELRGRFQRLVNALAAGRARRFS